MSYTVKHHTRNIRSQHQVRNRPSRGMSGITKLLLIAGAGLAVWYLPTLLALNNLTFDIISAIPTGADLNKISFLVTVRLKNVSNTTINMQYIKADILLNGIKIAEMSQAETMVIMPQSEQNFNIAFTLDAEVVGLTVLQQLMAQNLQNSVLNIRGTITGNNKTIPFDRYYTLQGLKV